jgi:hypothetical protein
MIKNISLQELIAVNSTPQAKKLVIKYGYSPARSYNDLLNKLKRLTLEHREDALKEFAEIHPHRDLILHYTQQENKVKEEVKSSCNGDDMCPSCRAKMQYSKFEGNEITSTSNNENQIKQLLPTIAITSLITAMLVVAIKSAK